MSFLISLRILLKDLHLYVNTALFGIFKLFIDRQQNPAYSQRKNPDKARGFPKNGQRYRHFQKPKKAAHKEPI